MDQLPAGCVIVLHGFPFQGWWEACVRDFVRLSERSPRQVMPQRAGIVTSLSDGAPNPSRTAEETEAL